MQLWPLILLTQELLMAVEQWLLAVINCRREGGGERVSKRERERERERNFHEYT